MDPEKRDDQYYRYKMPAIVTKVEGNGNGIKTVFPNIHEVCNVINRPESIMMKFFQFELGTQKTVSTKDDKFIVTGSRTQETMQEKVYAFITKFVLCKHCRNPETTITVDPKDRVAMRCGACGKTSMVSPNERCTSLLAQYYKNAKPTMKTEAPKQTSTADVVSGDAAAAALKQQTSPEQAAPAAMTEPALLDDRQNPAVILAKAILDNPNALDAHVRLVYELRSQFNLTDKTTVRLVFCSIVETNKEKFLGSLQTHSKLLGRFSLVRELAGDQALDETAAAEAKKREKPLQEALLSESERCVVGCGQHFKFPILLKILFEEGVLKQQSIEAWTPSSKLPKADAEQLKTLTQPLIEWLQASD